MHKIRLKKKVLQENKGLFKNEQKFKKRNKIKYIINKISSFLKIKINKKNAYFYYFVIGIFFLLVTIYLAIGPTLRLKHIEILKNDPITDINLSYKSLEDIRGKSIFNLDKTNIENKIKSYQKNIKTIKTNIALPNTLKITLESFSPLYNTKIGEKNFIITENGVFVPVQKPDKKLKILEAMGDINNSIKIIDYKEVFKQNYLININYLEKLLEDNILSLKIEKIKYYEIEREAHFIMNNGLILIFDLESGLDNQIEKLAIFNKEKFNLSKGNIIYLDLRVNDKIYYCEKEIKDICKKNLSKIYGN